MEQSNDEYLIGQFLKNVLTEIEKNTFSERLKDEGFRKEIITAKMLHIAAQESKEKTAMDKALDLYDSLSDEIQKTHPIKLEQDDVEFIAGLNSKLSPQEITDRFDTEESEDFAGFAEQEYYEDATLINRSRATEESPSMELKMFHLIQPQNKDLYKEELPVTLLETLESAAEIYVYNNYRDLYPEDAWPVTIEPGKKEKTLNIDGFEPGRYYLKIEAQGYKKVMRYFWVI